MTKAISKSLGFTIVELLVVIVVIGILAAITIVAYTGISQRAVVASLQSDLSNSSQQLKMYYTENGAYPASLDINNNCPVGPTDARYCLKSSDGNTLSYSSSSTSSFTLTDTNKNTVCYSISNNTSPSAGCAPLLLFSDDFNRADGPLASVRWTTSYYVPQGYEGRDPMTFNISSNAVTIGNGNSPFTGSAIYIAQSWANTISSLKLNNFYTDYGPYGTIYLYCRATAANQGATGSYNYYPTVGYGVVARNGGNGSKIVRFNNPSGYTIIADSGPDINPGDTISLKCSGSNISFQINNVTKLSVADSTFSSAGYVGFGANGNGFRFTGYVDNFVVNAP